jgi:DNA polymerase I-like protein with 3'-5' exonuclease and polymerase domains
MVGELTIQARGFGLNGKSSLEGVAVVYRGGEHTGFEFKGNFSSDLQVRKFIKWLCQHFGLSTEEAETETRLFIWRLQQQRDAANQAEQERQSQEDGGVSGVLFGTKEKNDFSENGFSAIQVNQRFMRDISKDAIDSLVQANTPTFIFLRGSELVRLSESGTSADILEGPALKGILDRCSNFIRITEDVLGREKTTPARPPGDVVKDILSQQFLPFPKLCTFANNPVFLPGGRLLATPGFDVDSGVYLNLDGLEGLDWGMPLEAAKDLLLNHLFVDFPFVDEASKAHAVSATLQPFVRQLISGPTPALVVDAPDRGTGKGLLVEVIAIVATGGVACPMAVPRDDDEVDKRITAMLLQGQAAILLDNATYLKSRSLSAALTATVYAGRVLGKTQVVYAPNTALWLATGNNVDMSDEINRRAALSRLDAEMEAPEERTGFKHPLPEWAVEHRPKLVSACLSIINHWVQEGMPLGTRTLGRFEKWAQVMGGILDEMGLPGFLGNREQQKSRDPERPEWAALCEVWWNRYQQQPITAKDVLALAKEKEQELLLRVWSGRSELAAQQRLGHALHEHRDRIYGPYKICQSGEGATHSHSYRLEKIENPKKDFTGGPDKTPKTPSDVMVDDDDPDAVGTVPADPVPPPVDSDGGVARPLDETIAAPAEDQMEEANLPVPAVDVDTPTSVDGFVDHRPVMVAAKDVNLPGVEVPLTMERVREWAAQYRSAKRVYLDTETYVPAPVLSTNKEKPALDPHAAEVRLLTITTEDGNTTIFDFHTLPVTEVIAELKNGILEGGPDKVGYNVAVYDARCLMKYGVTLTPVVDLMLGDQLVTSATVPDYLINARRKGHPKAQDVGGMRGLKVVLQDRVGRGLDKTEQVSDYSGPLTLAQWKYAAEDTKVLLPLREALDELLAEHELTQVMALENEAALALAQVGHKGIKIDEAKWKDVVADLEGKRDQLDPELTRQATTMGASSIPANWNSRDQIKKFLSDLLGFSVKSTTKESLANLEDRHPIITPIREYLKVTGKISRYGEKWSDLISPVTNRIHPDWAPIGASTGRQSGSRPPVQQLQRGSIYRKLLLAERELRLDEFKDSDFPAIEGRITAYYTGNEDFMRIFREGRNVHIETAAQISGKAPADIDQKGPEYAMAKTVRYALSFGGTAKNVKLACQREGIEITERQAQEAFDAFYRASPGLKEWQDQQKQVEMSVSLLGRKRYLPEPPPGESWFTDQGKPYNVFTRRINSPIQMTGADIIKLALVQLMRTRTPELVGWGPVLISHDSILVEGPEATGDLADEWLRNAMLSGVNQHLPRLPLQPADIEVKTSINYAGDSATELLEDDSHE